MEYNEKLDAICCHCWPGTRWLAVVVAGVAMTQAKVQVALGAGHRDELLALAALGVAAIRVYLLALRLALLVDVLAHGDVGLHSWGRGHGFAAEWTDGHLDVLPVGGGAVVPIVVVVRGAEDLVARVALHRQEIWRRGSKLIQLVFHFLFGQLCFVSPNLLQVCSLQCCPK